MMLPLGAFLREVLKSILNPTTKRNSAAADSRILAPPAAQPKYAWRLEAPTKLYLHCCQVLHRRPLWRSRIQMSRSRPLFLPLSMAESRYIFGSEAPPQLKGSRLERRKRLGFGLPVVQLPARVTSLAAVHLEVIISCRQDGDLVDRCKGVILKYGCGTTTCWSVISGGR